MMRRAKGALSSVVVSMLLTVPTVSTVAHASEPAANQPSMELRKFVAPRSARVKASQHGASHRAAGASSTTHIRHVAFRHIGSVADMASMPSDQPQIGLASWYGGRHWEGKRTSSGNFYDPEALTAAHATLPIGSRVRVSLIGSNREVIVTINDRPGTRRRIIDLSREAARELGILSRGVAMVTLTPL